MTIVETILATRYKRPSVHRIPWNAWVFMLASSWIRRSPDSRFIGCYMQYPHWIAGASNDNWKPWGSKLR